MTVVPITLREANAFVREHHRHRGVVRGQKFAIAASVDERVVGVAIVGRPVARLLQDGWTLEVNRLCTDGTRNACSFLYQAAWRVARALGFRRLVTYIASTESGASLRAAGWREVAAVRGQTWSRRSRPRVDLNPRQAKLRWERSAA